MDYHRHTDGQRNEHIKAVLVRAAADSAPGAGGGPDRRAAAVHANIIVMAILLTSTFGSLLTTALGPILLSQDSRVAPEGPYLRVPPA
ncbi:hypothetical protein EVAR_30691_1 [Eumeta japonica]|uniref:Uncharacterized protein n=1 Tax=Eumeta variegata TaxID=151549 RepID=A0A4C1VRD9_EUMVA|nr:hypothetical protein EVAR_30691_1 [Eumeta japonica]